MEKGQVIGTWWNDKNIELIQLDSGRVFALNGWNGDAYHESWECFGADHMESSEEHYIIRPVYREETGNDTVDILGYVVERR